LDNKFSFFKHCRRRAFWSWMFSIFKYKTSLKPWQYVSRLDEGNQVILKTSTQTEEILRQLLRWTNFCSVYL
jgi:hypothetical protein